MVEVYLLEMRISVYPNLKDVRRRKFSRANTVGKWVEFYCNYIECCLLTADLEGAMREEFEVPSSTECRVWKCMMYTYELLRPNQTLQEAGLSKIQQVLEARVHTERESVADLHMFRQLGTISFSLSILAGCSRKLCKL